MSRSTLLLALVLLCAAAGAAEAYPQFQISTGAQRCNQCHISPTGGTLLSGYGRDEAGDTISWGGDGAFLHGAWTPPEWLLLGGDLRAATLLQHENSGSYPTSFAYFPMQSELYTGIKAGPIILSLVAGYRGTVREGQTSPVEAWGSREHWVMWRPKTQGPYARLGRLRLPGGLRLPEHVFYVNRFGAQNLEEEPYALSGGVVKNDYEWHVSLFSRDPLRGVGNGRADYGVGAVYERRVGEKLVVAGQGRFAAYDEEAIGYDTRWSVGGYAKYWLDGPKLLLMAELDAGQKHIAAADYANKEVLAFGGVSWFPKRGWMVSASAETFLEDAGTPGTSRTAANLELQLFPTAHVELILLGRASGRHQIGMLQLHYYL